jgi:hypothetical protein
VRSGPTAWVNGPLVRVPLVGLLGLLHVPGAQMSRNYGIRRNQIYIPPEEKFSRAYTLIAMAVGVIVLGALLAGMLALAQLLVWVMP